MAGSTILIIALSLFGLAVSFFYMKKVTAIPLDLGLNKEESDRLKSIHGAIAEGAMAFLKQEYKVLVWFMLAFAVVIGLLTDNHETASANEGWFTAIAFVFGAAISILSGYIGQLYTSMSKDAFFFVLMVLGLGSGAMMWAFNKPLKKALHHESNAAAV